LNMLAVKSLIFKHFVTKLINNCYCVCNVYHLQKHFHTRLLNIAYCIFVNQLKLMYQMKLLDYPRLNLKSMLVIS